MKVIFFDIDGTLVPFDGGISESTKKAINLAKANGHKIFLCSGRSRTQLIGPVKELPYDGIVAAAGACIEIGGKLMHEEVIDQEHEERFLSLFEHEDISFGVQTKDGIYTTKSGYEKTKERFLLAGCNNEQMEANIALFHPVHKVICHCHIQQDVDDRPYSLIISVAEKVSAVSYKPVHLGHYEEHRISLHSEDNKEQEEYLHTIGISLMHGREEHKTGEHRPESSLKEDCRVLKVLPLGLHKKIKAGSEQGRREYNSKIPEGAKGIVLTAHELPEVKGAQCHGIIILRLPQIDFEGRHQRPSAKDRRKAEHDVRQGHQYKVEERKVLFREIPVKEKRNYKDRLELKRKAQSKEDKSPCELILVKEDEGKDDK